MGAQQSMTALFGGQGAVDPSNLGVRDVCLSTFKMNLDLSDAAEGRAVLAVEDEDDAKMLGAKSLVLLDVDEVVVMGLRHRSDDSAPLWVTLCSAASAQRRGINPVGYVEQAAKMGTPESREVVVEMWFPLRSEPLSIDPANGGHTPAVLGHALAEACWLHTIGCESPGHCELGQLCATTRRVLDHALDGSGVSRCDSRVDWCDQPGCTVVSRMLAHASMCRVDDCLGCLVHRGEVSFNELLFYIQYARMPTTEDKESGDLANVRNALPKGIRRVMEPVPFGQPVKTTCYSFRSLTSSMVVLLCPAYTDPDAEYEVVEEIVEETTVEVDSNPTAAVPSLPSTLSMSSATSATSSSSSSDESTVSSKAGAGGSSSPFDAPRRLYGASGLLSIPERTSGTPPGAPGSERSESATTVGSFSSDGSSASELGAVMRPGSTPRLTPESVALDRGTASRLSASTPSGSPRMGSSSPTVKFGAMGADDASTTKVYPHTGFSAKTLRRKMTAETLLLSPKAVTIGDRRRGSLTTAYRRGSPMSTTTHVA